MQVSENQGYRPRWGIASDNKPRELFVSDAPRAQLVNTQGMGWMGLEDIEPRYLASSANALCRQIAPEATDEERRMACEFLFFLRAAFDRIEIISPDGFAKAVESLGTGYVGQWNHDGASVFGPGRHDGPELVRPFQFDDRCGQEGAPCFKYVGPPRPLRR
jgi:hypothetical protein